MPIFRFHRGSLEESLKTCVHVKDIDELEKAVNEMYGEDGLFSSGHFTISNYGFDARIGWFTQIVTYDVDFCGVLGFLSEPFAGDK